MRRLGIANPQVLAVAGGFLHDVGGCVQRYSGTPGAAPRTGTYYTCWWVIHVAEFSVVATRKGSWLRDFPSDPQPVRNLWCPASGRALGARGPPPGRCTERRCNVVLAVP